VSEADAFCRLNLFLVADCWRLIKNSGENYVKKFIYLSLIVFAAIGIGACGSAGTESSTGKNIGEVKVSDKLTVALVNEDGKLKNGEQTLKLVFTDGSGKPVEMKAATLNFNMPKMGSMAEMNDPATLTTSGSPGVFEAKVKLQMAGEWIAQISYEGAETGKTTIKTTAY